MRVADGLRAKLALALLFAATVATAVIVVRGDHANANPLGGIATIAAGSGHTCAITTTGDAKCWGFNSDGQLGNGVSGFGERSLIPVDVSGLAGVQTMGGGSQHTCGIVSGALSCWGSNDKGELGLGSFTTGSSVPVAVPTLTADVTAVTLGVEHSCAIVSGGVKCWGFNGFGQVGDGSLTSAPGPIDVPALSTGVAAIDAKSHRSCAVMSAGTVKCWGRYFGLSPQDVAGIPEAVQSVAVGDSHACVLTVSATVMCWGANFAGQLGDGTTLPTPSVLTVSGIPDTVVQLDAAFNHTCALTDAGQVFCWGRDDFGQLGSPPADPCFPFSCSASPHVVPGLSDIIQISLGAEHTCALDTGPAVWCWGLNDQGQLGDGTTTPREEPAKVVELVAKVTPTPTATACPQACPTPVPTPTPVPESSVMSLAVSGNDTSCSGAPDSRVCSVLLDTPFTLSVSADSLPPRGGYIGIQTEITLGSLTYKPSNAAVDEVPWPDSAFTVRSAAGAHVAIAASTGLVPPHPVSTYLGEIIRVRLTCTGNASSNAVVLMPYSEVNSDGSGFKGSNPPLFPNYPARTRVRYVDANGDSNLELVLAADALTVNCVEPPTTPTPTATPTNTPPSIPQMQKLPPLQNLFLSRQGTKIPPLTCLAGDDAAVFSETLSMPIPVAPDPKDPSEAQQLGAFEFEVHFDPDEVCVEIEPGTAADNMICFVDDASSSQLEGVARIGCVTKGKQNFPDTTAPGGRHLADIIVRPQPEVYSQAKPSQDNGVVAQITNSGCELADLQGHPIPVYSCDDADLTMRYLEGDVEPDCSINVMDTQAIAFRWGALKGSLFYKAFMNLEPWGGQADNDIDIKDLQFVFGRFASTCAAPHPQQQPVNPKA